MTKKKIPHDARKVEIWAEISRLLKEYELSQTEAIRAEIEKSYDSLRQKLQVLALDSATDADLEIDPRGER